MIFQQLFYQNSGTYTYLLADENAREAKIIDCEFGHFVGAKNIPLDELRTQVKEALIDKPVVVVCQTDRLSAFITQLLAHAGVPGVANLVGGIVVWRSLGLPDGTA